MPLSDPPHQANAITLPHKAAEMVKCSHAALGSPALSTLKEALKKNYVKGFPGLTLDNLN